jgi:F420-non-reducing hydrogenase large subunit
VVDPSGKEFLKFGSQDYLEHIGEHVKNGPTANSPTLKQSAGKVKLQAQTAEFTVGSTGRLNASNGMATPLAQQNIGNVQNLGGKPVHSTLAFHWHA